jgi:hypothetical protein
MTGEGGALHMTTISKSTHAKIIQEDRKKGETGIAGIRTDT